MSAEKLNLTLKIWRQKGPDDRGHFESYKVDAISDEASFLEMLDVLNERLIAENREPVVFDHEGFVTLGCNIHDWMVAYIAVVATPYFQITGRDGRAVLKDLAPGQYTVAVWHPLLKGRPDASAQHVDFRQDEANQLLFSLDLKPDFRARRAPGLSNGGYP